MAVNPPYQLIESMGKMEAERQPMWGQALQGILTGIKSYQDTKEAKLNRESDVMKTFLTNYSLRPTDPTQPSQGPVAGDIISAMNRGKTPSTISPAMVGMTAVPKMDTSLLAHVLPAILNNQPQGTPTPVQGGITAPGAIPGISADASVTKPAPKTDKSDSRHSDSMLSQAATAARASVQQMISQAMADPKSAQGPKAFPILDSKTAHEQYVKEFKKEAAARGISEEDANTRMDAVEKQFKDEQKNYEQDLAAGLKIANREKDEKRKKQLKATIRQRLAQKYPVNTYAINNHPELK